MIPPCRWRNLPGPGDRAAEHVDVIVRIVACQRLIVGDLGLHQGLVHIGLHQVVVPVGHAVALPGVTKLERDVTRPAQAVDKVRIERVLRIRLQPLEGGRHIRELRGPRWLFPSAFETTGPVPFCMISGEESLPIDRV